MFIWCLTSYILLFSVLWTASRALPRRSGVSDFYRFWSEPQKAELTFPLTAFNMWHKDLLKYQRKMHRPPVIC